MTAIKEFRPTEQQILSILPSTSSNSDSINCNLCSKRFQNRSAKRFHMFKTHKISSSDGTWTGLDHQLGVDLTHKSLQLQFVCPKQACFEKQKRFASAKLLLQHYQKTHLEKSFKCPDCGSKFSLSRDLNYHLRKRCPARKVGGLESYPMNPDVNREVRSKKRDQQTQTCVPENVGVRRFLLVPTNKYRWILPRPQPACITATSSTQVETPNECAEEWLAQEYIEESTHNHYEQSNYVDIGLQADFPQQCFGEFDEQLEPENNSNYCYSTNSTQQQHQDSFSQTAYPQTVDFGTQYAASGNRAALELPPLKSTTRSTANALVGTDGNSSKFLAQMPCNGASMSQHYLDSSASNSNSNYWRHTETQTSSGHWEHQQDNNTFCTQGMFAAVAAQQNFNAQPHKIHNMSALDEDNYNCVETQTMCQWTVNNAQPRVNNCQLPESHNLNTCQYRKTSTVDFSCMTDVNYN